MAVPANSQILDHEPDWHQGPQSNGLIDADTGKLFSLTPHEREICVKALEALDDHTRILYGRTVAHIKAGEQINLGDVIFLNGPLMTVQQPQYGFSEADIVQIKQLLDRLRKAAVAMVGTK